MKIQFGYLKLILLLTMIFWFAFYLKVRLEWIFGNNQQEIEFARDWYKNKKSEISFLLKIMGVIWYSPYLWPVEAILIWVFILLTILVNW